jgi:hypothetical protein
LNSNISQRLISKKLGEQAQAGKEKTGELYDTAKVKLQQGAEKLKDVSSQALGATKEKLVEGKEKIKGAVTH